MRSNRLYIRLAVSFECEHLFLLVVKISLLKNKPTDLRLLASYGRAPVERSVPKSCIKTFEKVGQCCTLRRISLNGYPWIQMH